MRLPSYTVFILLTLVACSSPGNLPSNPQALDLQPQLLAQPSPLIIAVRDRNSEAFRQAMASGAKVNGTFEGQTALRLAIESDQRKFARILLRAGADWRLATQAGEASMLMTVAERGYNDLLKQLILLGAAVDYRDSAGYSALVKAARQGHLTTMKILINAGADPNVVADGKSLLMHVVEDNNALLSQLLIKAGADVNFMAENGQTALRIARDLGYFDIDLMLVQAGARY